MVVPFFKAVSVFTLFWLVGTTISSPTGFDKVKSYSGYKLIRTFPLPNSNLVDAVIKNFDGKDGIQLWTRPKLSQMLDILSSPENYAKVTSILTEIGLKYETLHDDIDKLIQKEKLENFGDESQSRRAKGHRMTWSRYHRYKDIYEYCQYLASTRGSSARRAMVTMEIIGKTSENRDIILMKVSKGTGGNKPAIWLDGGMHAREWISPATLTYILNTLVYDQKKSGAMLAAFDWFIVPVVNIDGYEFSHTFDRLWRKTRSRTSNFSCPGVDPNRNYDFKWGTSGSSNDPCSEIYLGTKPFSEPETKSNAKAILARNSTIKMYISLHSYDQSIIVPWAYGNEKPKDYNDLYNLGVKGKQALEATYQTQYKVGTAPDLLDDPAGGGSDDWAKGVAGIKYSYTFELRDTGRFGFLLPRRQIRPTGEETFNAVRAMAMALRDTLKTRTNFIKVNKKKQNR